MSTACNWTSMDEKVLFIPGTTGPCVGSLLGMTVKARCGLQCETGYCNVVRYNVRIDQYDNYGNITEGVSSIDCTDIAFDSTECGNLSNEENICLDPPHPNNYPFQTDWENAHYRVIVSFFDSNLGAGCGSGNQFDQLVGYIWRDYGYWSTTDNPFP